MTRVSRARSWRTASASFVVATTLVACGSRSELLEQASRSCDELRSAASGDAVDTSRVDARVRHFLRASSDLRAVSDQMKLDLRSACASLARDLGAEDTWSPLGDDDASVSGAQDTGACDAARARIDALMRKNVAATFALLLAHGRCRQDFEAEAACEAACSAQSKCEPGDLETRCAPADLAVLCDGLCNGTCEGSPTAPASCRGKCEGRCHGECAGTCVGESGVVTTSGGACDGKCQGLCTGQCGGDCRIEDDKGLECGAGVACRAGCGVHHTDARCEGEIGAPACKLDPTCFESCRVIAAAKARCDAPAVRLIADVRGNPEAEKLVATIEKNLPAIVSLADERGRFIVKAANALAAAGRALKTSGALDAHSLTCAASAAKTASDAASFLALAARSGDAVVQACGSNAK
jgi:hypothetical protein